MLALLNTDHRVLFIRFWHSQHSPRSDFEPLHLLTHLHCPSAWQPPSMLPRGAPAQSMQLLCCQFAAPSSQPPDLWLRELITVNPFIIHTVINWEVTASPSTDFPAACPGDPAQTEPRGTAQHVVWDPLEWGADRAPHKARDDSWTGWSWKSLPTWVVLSFYGLPTTGSAVTLLSPISAPEKDWYENQRLLGNLAKFITIHCCFLKGAAFLSEGCCVTSIISLPAHTMVNTCSFSSWWKT